jgi:hypothetical protein
MAASIAFVLAGRYVWTEIDGNFDEISDRLYAHKGIYELRVTPIEEDPFGIITDVLGFTCKIGGRPNTYIAINTPDIDLFSEARSIHLDGLDGLLLVATYIDDQLHSSGTGGVNIAADSDLRSVLPFTIRNLDELISRYDELVAALRKWPRSSSPGVVELSPTTRIAYYVVPK